MCTSQSPEITVKTRKNNDKILTYMLEKSKKQAKALSRVTTSKR